MNTQYHPPGRGYRAVVFGLAALAAALPSSFAQKVAAPQVEPAAEPRKPVPVEQTNTGAAAPSKDDAISLSPFEVSSNKDQGYFAANTLAGSRLNTNLADLGASISVVNKQLMDDTASLDINDVFRYEVNTEGSTTYTPSGSGYATMRSDGLADANSGATLGSSTTPFTNASANRVRGIGVPGTAINYYPSIGQVPMDSYNVQSVEISRGPNSMLFGMGSPAGITNQTTAQARTDRDSNSLSLQTDQYGSRRSSFSFNRSLIKGRLGIYGAALYDDRRFDRQPAYDFTRRQYLAFTARPFSGLTIRGNVENYSNQNRRPNTLTPRDYVTQWNSAGQPYYDPLTRKVMSQTTGKVLGVYVADAASPYANEARAFIESLPGYNPALWNSARTTYNGISIFGEAAMTNVAGFVPGKSPATSALFVPGLIWGTNTRSVMQIADGQLQSWYQPLFTQVYRTAWGTAANPAANAPTFPTAANVWANPTWADVYNRDFTMSNGWTGIGNNLVGYKYPGVTNSAIYDWRDVNINQMNFGADQNTNVNLELEQRIRDDLYLSAGWFRQNFDSRTNYTVAQLNVATLFVDTNKFLPTGAANPYFGKPFVMDFDPDRYVNQQLDDHYRAMLAWTPDFTRRDGFLKALGRHQVVGLWSRDESMRTSLRQRLEYVEGLSPEGRYRYMANANNNANGSATGWNYQTTSLQRWYYLAGPGDPNGTVTRGSGEWNSLDYTGNIRVYDYANSRFDNVGMRTIYNTFDASTGRTERLVNSVSAGITSYFWKDRLITTVGVRQDDYQARSTTNAQIFRQALSTGAPSDVDLSGKPVVAGRPVPILPAMTNQQKWTNGYYNTDVVFNRWNRWDELSGTTRTLGAVLRPFQGWGPIERQADRSLAGEIIRDFGVSYNKSDNFNAPDTAQTDAFGVPLPKPTGEGRDYGFQFSALRGKLFARVTWFDGTNENERTNPGTSISRLTSNVDTTLFRNWARTIAMINMGMDPRLSTFGSNLTPAQETQIQSDAEKIWRLPYAYYDGMTIYATRSAKVKGTEAEVNYNPTRNWTMRFTFGHQDASYSRVLGEFNAWYAVRAPVWQGANAANFLLPQYQNLATYNTAGGTEVNLTNFWSSYGYRPEVLKTNPVENNVVNYYNSVVTPQLALARDLDGQSAPGQRKNRWAFVTRYSFDHGALKGVALGGGQRWEDKSIIGYYGKSSGTSGAQIDVSDITRPIYSGANSYTDLWVSYSRKIWSGKVGMKMQVNVSNVFENGYLQTVGVNYDGSPFSFRIIDPRLIRFSTTFDF